jgi:lysophospholipase L1-like esterase
MQLRDFQRALVNSRKNEGDEHIYFLDGSGVLGDDYDECTVDGVHPNDLGSMRIAEGLYPVLATILSAHPFMGR